MAQRDKLPVSLLWVLVDLDHPASNALINVASLIHRQHGGELSVNTNAAGTQALVKIAESETGFRNALSGAAKNAIVAVYDETTHQQALDLVRSPEWEPIDE